MIVAVTHPNEGEGNCPSSSIFKQVTLTWIL